MLIFLVFALLGLVRCNLTGGGFGAGYSWVSWSTAKAVASEQDRPIALIFHKTWCGACKKLKPKVAHSKELLEVSQKFVMVNVEDEEEPSSDPDFNIDGGYIPRIIFLDSEGNIRPEYSNKARGDRYKYFYPSSGEILDSMEQVLATIKTKQEL